MLLQGLKSITFPDTVVHIGDSAFYLCRNLAAVNFGKGLTSNGGHIGKRNECSRDATFNGFHTNEHTGEILRPKVDLSMLPKVNLGQAGAGL